MTASARHHSAAEQRRRQIRLMQMIFAGAAITATILVSDVTRPGTAETVVAAGSVRLADRTTDLPAPAAVPFGPRLPQTTPNAVGQGGFAADDDDDQDERNRVAQQTEEEWNDYFSQDEDPNVNNPNDPNNP
jgi:hypothetical protein